MPPRGFFPSFAWLCVRLVLALILVFAAVAVFQEPEPPRGTAKPWISPDAPTVIPAFVYGVVFGGSALLLIAGWRVPIAVVALNAMLIAVTVERLIRNPFTNLTADVALIMALALALLAAGSEQDRWSLDARGNRTPMSSVDRWSWITLFLRLFIGAIFFMQGFRNVFLGGGPIAFAERLYVKPFAGTMPEPLLWIAGVSNPFVQFGAGLLLILGLFTRTAAAIAALFLVSIVFGHLMQGALTAPAAMRDFATANFIVMIAVIIAATCANRWSVDAVLLNRRKQT